MILEKRSAETGFPKIPATTWNLERGSRVVVRDCGGDPSSIERLSRAPFAVNYLPGTLWADPALGQPASQTVWLHGEGRYNLAAGYGFAMEGFGHSPNSINVQRGSPNTDLMVSGSILSGQPIRYASGHSLNPINVQQASPVTALMVAGSILYGQPLEVLLEYDLGVRNTTAFVASWSSLRAVETPDRDRAELEALNIDRLGNWVPPTEANVRLLQMATVTHHAIKTSSVIFAGSRSLSPEERADQKRFYKKTYKKI